MFFFQHHLMWIICFFFFSARFLISFFHVCIPLPFLSFPLARKRKQGKKRKWKTEAVWTKFIPMTAVIGKKGERAKENISVSALQLHNPSLNCSYFFFCMKAQSTSLVLIDWRAAELFYLRSEKGMGHRLCRTSFYVEVFKKDHSLEVTDYCQFDRAFFFLLSFNLRIVIPHYLAGYWCSTHPNNSAIKEVLYLHDIPFLSSKGANIHIFHIPFGIYNQDNK